MDALLGDRSLLYVTGKGGVGKTTVAAALGLAAARTGRRTIVCEVAEQDRMSRAFARHGVRAEQEVELAEDLWAITIDPQAALEEWLAKQVGGTALKVLGHSHAFQYFVAAAPGAKELITIAKVWELAQAQRWNRGNRSYDLVVVDAPASGHGIGMLTTPRTFAEIARVGPDPPPGLQGLRDARRPRAHRLRRRRAAGGDAGQRDDRARGQAARARSASALDAIVMNAMWPEAFTVARRDQAARRVGRRRGGAPRCPCTSGSRRSARTCGGWTSETDAPVTTLPFVFESELELSHYEELATAFAASLVV